MGFLTALVGKAKYAKEIHIVLDNLAAHKTQAVEQFLAEHPKVRFHFTPTYSSWLNQVEIWFAKIERDVIARGVFTSVSDLRRKLMKYLRAHAQRARPIRWTYTDVKKRITAKRITGTGYYCLTRSSGSTASASTSTRCGLQIGMQNDREDLYFREHRCQCSK